MFESLQMIIFLCSIPFIMKASVALMKFMLTDLPDFEDLKGDEEDDDAET